MDLPNQTKNIIHKTDFVHCCCYITHADFDTSGNPTIQIINSVLILPICLAGVLGNLLVTLSIWRTPSLHTPTYLWVLNLALSDLAISLIVEPCFFVRNFAKIENLPELFCSSAVALGITAYCLIGVTLSTLAVISVDRYLALRLHLRYQEVVTVRRVWTAVLVIWLVCVMNGTMYYWYTDLAKYLSLVSTGISILALTISSCKIYRVVWRHKIQIEDTQVGQQAAENSFNVARYKKTFISMLFIFFVFLLCTLPYTFSMALIINTGRTVARISFLEVTLVLLFLNSTLNPLLYFWRFRYIREAAKETARKYLCRGTPA